MPSLTIENYVKTIYQICIRHNGRPAATGKVADALHVLPGTVTSMLKSLQETGLAFYTPYEGVRLSDTGERLALRVIRRHRLIELFLVKTLNLSWDEVHEEAENMEHAVSDLLVDRIDRYLDYPETDPHGDPIPRADGTVPRRISESLSQWEVGKAFRLVRVLDQSPQFLRYLTQNRLSLGSEGVVQARQDDSGGVIVAIDDAETVLEKSAADKLLVAAAN